jgi:hypothetical protein
MPKLVVKHELPPSSPQEKLVKILQIVLPAVLLVIALAAVLSWYLAPDTEEPAFLAEPAVGVKLPAVYTRHEEKVKAMGDEFDRLAHEGIEDYERNLQLVTKAEGILQQLTEMDGIVQGLKMSEQDRQTLLSRHQYQKDYWESKRVFHRLRLARFKVNSPAVTQDALREAVGEALDAHQSKPPAVAAPAIAPAAAGEKSTKAGALPPGVKLPPGFCPLFGPDAGSCKPGKGEKKP